MNTLDLDTLRRLATLGGFTWSESELEAIRPALERALAGLERMERLPLAEVEPTTQYRML
jgi:Asp-tRNA(Asn)/Glu-tRNA(Gln) amidotransferase C subunit